MNKNGAKRVANGVQRAIIFGFLFLTSAHRAVGGPLPLPVEAHLDMAKAVVIGPVTQMVDSDFRRGEQVHWGRATVAVEETLKGIHAKTFEFFAASWVDPKFGGASAPRTVKVGDRGIWLIGTDGILMHSFGFLPEERKADVQGILKALEGRKWSEPVNGLRAWAGVVRSDYYRRPVIIFEVNNVSDADIFVPVAGQAGVTATVRNEDGRVWQSVLSRGEPQSDGVFCQKLLPGEIVCLHPEYSFIDLAWSRNLPPGKYSVVVGCSNWQPGKVGPTPTVPVAAWKGELKAPPVELVLASDETRQKPAQQGAPPDATERVPPETERTE